MAYQATGTTNQRDQARRHPRADGKRTRGAILRTAASLATIDGLEGRACRSGTWPPDRHQQKRLYAHFGSKQELELATVEEAERIFDAEVVQPALTARPGLAQLVAICDAYLSYLQRHVFPGGCFFATTGLEMSTHPGPVKERIAAVQAGFTATLNTFAATALERHELRAREDPNRLAFELHAILLAADTKCILHDDPTVLDLARQVVHQRARTRHKQKRRRHLTSWPPAPACPPATARGHVIGQQTCEQRHSRCSHPPAFTQSAVNQVTPSAWSTNAG